MMANFDIFDVILQDHSYKIDSNIYFNSVEFDDRLIHQIQFYVIFKHVHSTRIGTIFT